MSDMLKRIQIEATLLDVTFDEWDYVKDALGTLATMGVLTKLNITMERGTVPPVSSSQENPDA